ncbi:MAG: FAD-dependent oxidoreductase [Azospirillaceae bacterium]|nr:FAD-dependent oxidoreductase [Azospirillaceae bacterium]
MKKQIVIAGNGFAGLWAALSAARAVSLAGKEQDIEVTVVSPSPTLIIRPRLYEAALDNVSPDLGALFQAVGISHVAGRVDTIRTETREVDVDGADGHHTLAFDKFILATGSVLYQPPVPGLAEHGFNVDQFAAAKALDAHLQSLADQPDRVARNTVVVVGGGLTGIETAAEMPRRLRAILGGTVAIRVVLIEQAPVVGSHLGAAARSVVEQALAACGVEIITDTAVSAIEAGRMVTSTGRIIETDTVVWTTGARANPLAAQIAGEHDRLGRIHADPYLRAGSVTDVFVAGDVAYAASDKIGNHALMSCQHALSLGRVAGYNAAAELVGLPLHPYSQPKYVTCIDLGPWGGLYTEGWDPQVRLTRDEAKALKVEITTKWIYPPAADHDAAFAIANPDFVIVP